MDAFPYEDFRAGDAYALAAVIAEHLDQAGIDGSGAVSYTNLESSAGFFPPASRGPVRGAGSHI